MVYPQIHLHPQSATGDWRPDALPDSVIDVSYPGPDPTPVVLCTIGDSDVAANVDRIVAAVGARMLSTRTPSRRGWLAAAAIVLDEQGARRCCAAGLPRRDSVLVVGSGEPSTEAWAAAVDVGAEQVCLLPEREDELVRRLADAVESGAGAGRMGRVIAVTGGRGGAGASVFATAMAQCAGDALLVDVDPCGGGVDLVSGTEDVPGLRWPDLRVHGGRLAWSALRDVLPGRNRLRILSGTRRFHDIEPMALAAVLDASRRGGVTAVCDIPRQLTAAARCALQHADLTVVVTGCDVRGAAAAAATVSVLTTVNPSIGLVVRGPSPGGLLADEVAAAAAAPLLAAMRPEPVLAQRLEQGGLQLRPRSPLAAAARIVLQTVHRNAGGRAA